MNEHQTNGNYNELLTYRAFHKPRRLFRQYFILFISEATKNLGQLTPFISVRNLSGATTVRAFFFVGTYFLLHSFFSLSVRTFFFILFFFILSSSFIHYYIGFCLEYIFYQLKKWTSCLLSSNNNIFLCNYILHHIFTISV